MDNPQQLPEITFLVPALFYYQERSKTQKVLTQIFEMALQQFPQNYGVFLLCWSGWF